MQIPFGNIKLDFLQNNVFTSKGITISVLRLDEIDKHVSGNKLFKLHNYVKQCLLTKHKTILTFGGAYSNHLAATAYLCAQKNIKCIGIVRGEKPMQLSHTLQNCEAWGMHIHYVSREQYSLMQAPEFIDTLNAQYGAYTMVPEGGYGAAGVAGAALIMDVIKEEKATHICTSVGTATTLAGLLTNNINDAKIIAVPAIKNMTDIGERIITLTQQNYDVMIWGDYHFGGYAKHTKALFTFMNNFYNNYQIPTDFIYTGKMMYAVLDQVNQNYFTKGDHIICLHTGGLQGNLSLPKHTLIF